MGRTLFGPLAAPLRALDAGSLASHADELYGAVRKARRRLAAGATPASGT
jgi:hypothetical protein